MTNRVFLIQSPGISGRPEGLDAAVYTEIWREIADAWIWEWCLTGWLAI